MSLLQIFLLLDMFVLGIAATIAAQHAYTHFLHKRHPEKDHTALKDSPLPPQLKEQLIKDAHRDFQDVLDKSADGLRHDLKDTSDRINLHLKELGNDTIHKETEKYREQLKQLYDHAEKDVEQSVAAINDYIKKHRQQLGELGDDATTVITDANKDIENYKQELKAKLDALHQSAETAISDADSEIEQHTKDLKQQLSETVDAEKQLILEQFDTKLADAVVSFLMETLKHDIDLGAQSKYLTATLDEHKKELLDGLKQ